MKEIVEKSVDMIELCPGVGNEGVGRVTAAAGDGVVFGMVRLDRLPLLECKSGDTEFNQ